MTARHDELLPYSMQLGSGTWDPIVGVLYQGSATPWWWGVNATRTVRPFENAHSYSLGDETRVDLYSMQQIRYDTVLEYQLSGFSWGAIEGQLDETRSGQSGRAEIGNPNSNFTTPPVRSGQLRRREINRHGRHPVATDPRFTS